MKKFITLAFIAVIFTTKTFAAGHEKAYNKAAANLEVNYPGAKNVAWSYTDRYAKANITIGQQKLDVYYDEYGELIGATKTIAFDKLPKPALDTITTEYTFPDYQLTDCIQFTDADNNTTYYVSFDFGDSKTVLSIASDGTVAQM